MSWTPIQDIPDPEEALEVSELRALDQLWKEQRSELEKKDGMKRFWDRLARSWAIETGVIERVYDLDRGTTDLLIEKGIDADLIDRASTDREPRLVGRIIRDHVTRSRASSPSSSASVACRRATSRRSTPR
jgi:hypothetical protein